MLEPKPCVKFFVTFWFKTQSWTWSFLSLILFSWSFFIWSKSIRLGRGVFVCLNLSLWVVESESARLSDYLRLCFCRSKRLNRLRLRRFLALFSTVSSPLSVPIMLKLSETNFLNLLLFYAALLKQLVFCLYASSNPSARCGTCKLEVFDWVLLFGELLFWPKVSCASTIG